MINEINNEDMMIGMAMCIAHDAVIMPVRSGARKMAHFQLPINEWFIRELYDVASKFGCSVRVGLLFVGHEAADNGVMDFLVFRDDEVWDEFSGILDKRCAYELTKKEMNHKIGRFFGYTEEAIGEYIADYEGGQWDIIWQGDNSTSTSEWYKDIGEWIQENLNAA